VNADAPINSLIDPIRDCLSSGRDASLLVLVLAAWLRRVRGEDESGKPIEVVSPLAGVLRERAIEGGANPRPLRSIRAIFGELIDHGSCVHAVAHWLGLLYAIGAKSTLSQARSELQF
jgi:mannitol 2-dehydrogenase